jgi:hypothetical protein
MFFSVLNLALYFKLSGLVLNLELQYWQINPSQFKKVSHIWQRFCLLEYRPIPTGFSALWRMHTPLQVISAGQIRCCPLVTFIWFFFVWEKKRILRHEQQYVLLLVWQELTKSFLCLVHFSDTWIMEIDKCITRQRLLPRKKIWTIKKEWIELAIAQHRHTNKRMRISIVSDIISP